MTSHTVAPAVAESNTSPCDSCGASMLATSLELITRISLRFSLIGVLLYVGGMKFTAYEAQAISGLINNHPLMVWMYRFLTERETATLIGITELTIALLLAVRPWFPRLSAIGSLLAVGMFGTTLSFLLTTPGVIEPDPGFPALSVMPGQFLIKDAGLLAIALWTLSDSMQASRSR